MATKKPAAKAAAKKPAPKKAIAAPAKKTVTAKKAVPAKKAAPAKKSAPKPVAKKQVAKPAPKKALKSNAKKPIAVATRKSVTKSASKQVTKKAAPLKKQVKQVTSKKDIKKPAAKATAAKAPAKPIAKAPAGATPKSVVKTVAKIPERAIAKTPVKAIAAAKATPVKTTVKPAPAKPTVPKPVVLPKINTKTSRKYEPDFTKSVLDQAPPDPGAPIVMYSDNDLSEFRELIQRKMGSAKKELAYLQGLITRKDDMGGDEGDNRYMTMEDGSLSMEREQLSQMASRQITFIDHLEKALMRIENKTYGVCRVTGKLIDKARLRAVPHATLSIEAKMSNGR